MFRMKPKGNGSMKNLQVKTCKDLTVTRQMLT